MSFKNVPWPNDGFGDSQSSNDGLNDNFNSVTDNFNSTFRWAAAVSIMAIVYAIIDCLKKAGDAIPNYARLSNSDESSKLSVSSVTPDAGRVTIPPNFPVISDSQMEAATVERFINDMNKEKAVRFSPHQLESFTKNYSTVLVAGGFGVVYKGELPNGEEIAVKVLNINSSKRVEEQFMAEVNTVGRTYHINLVRLHGFCFDYNARRKSRM